jgi:type III restriction enzyme
LPRWFTIPTPVGDYNPDWAVVLEEDQKVYLIRETKSTHDADKRRLEENQKIKCGKAHFEALGIKGRYPFINLMIYRSFGLILKRITM